MELLGILFELFVYTNITLGISNVFLVTSLHLKVSKWQYLCVLTIIYLITNIMGGVVLKYYFGHLYIYQIAYLIETIISHSFIVIYNLYATYDKLAKIGAVYLIVEMSANLCLGVTVLVVKFILSYILGSDSSENGMIENIILIILGIIYIWVSVSKQGQYLATKLRNYKLKYEKLWIALFYISLMCSIISIVKTSPALGEALYFSYISIVVVTISIIIAYLVYQRLKQQRLYNENKALLVQQNLMAEYYSALEERMTLTRKLRHDIANHIQTLETLMALEHNSEMQEYAQNIRKQYKQLHRISYCKDLVIDSVIYSKNQLCARKSIRTDIHITSLERGNIPEIELLSILYNLFDNAIEACEKIEDSGQRFIELHVKNIANHLIIKMKNSCMDMPKMKNGKIFTSKKNKEMHGIGMSIIEDFATKHNGVMDIKTEDKSFEITVVMEFQ